jgi:hypothetical protein
MRNFLLAVACGLLAACGQAKPIDNASGDNMFAPTEDTSIQWRQLADGSFGWSLERGQSVTAERCWKAGSRFQCVNISRMPTCSDMEVCVDKTVLVSSFFRDTLRRERIHSEHGYSCVINVGSWAIESLSLSSGATIQNQISLDIYPGVFWTADFVHKFVAQNSPDTPVIYFRCAVSADLLQRGNEAALLTTAITAEDLGLPKA